MPSEKPPDPPAGRLGKADLVKDLVGAASGRPAAVATIRRWLRALRPGWKLEASSTAPTWRTGSASSR